MTIRIYSIPVIPEDLEKGFAIRMTASNVALTYLVVRNLFVGKSLLKASVFEKSS
jgi:hypothetical protein